MLEIYKFSIVFSSSQYWEINLKSVNKGVTVKWLYDSLKIDKKNTIDIEGSDNDVYMINKDG